MRIAVTGATGFLGRYLVAELVGQGHHCRCWYRMTSDRSGFPVPQDAITWVPGDLDDPESAQDLLQHCDAVVHAALFRPSRRFMGGEGDILPFVEKNILGTIRLIETARRAGLTRFIFISTCAVHDKILDDRPLDETHPLWPASHYGAHKAALEAFVHSYGFGHGFPICALRRPASTAWPTRPRRASGSTWSPRSRAGRTSYAAAAERKSTPPTSPARRPCS